MKLLTYYNRARKIGGGNNNRTDRRFLKHMCCGKKKAKISRFLFQGAHLPIISLTVIVHSPLLDPYNTNNLNREISNCDTSLKRLCHKELSPDNFHCLTLYFDAQFRISHYGTSFPS